MAEYEQALAIYGAHEHPERGIVLYNMGLLRAAAGDHAGALRSYVDAQPIIEHGAGTSSRRYAELVLATADARLALGEAAVAHAGYLEAQALAAALGDGSLGARVQQGLTASTPTEREVSEPDQARPSSVRKRSVRVEPKPPEPSEPPGAYAPGPGWDEP
jgi:hypothetical protein